MSSFDRPLLAVLLALGAAAAPVLFYSLHVEAKPLDTVGVVHPAQLWARELAPVMLPEIVITATRSAEPAGPTR